MPQDLSYALTNVLGVATWYIIGIAYVSLAARYWPKDPNMRGKWTPWDVYHEFSTNKEYQHFSGINPLILVFAVSFTFFAVLTVWPYSVYCHAKRNFRPGKVK